MKMKKSLAIMLAVAMMTGSAGTVLAAGPYSDAEKKANEAALSEFAVLYEDALAEAEPMMQGEKAAVADLKIELGDTVRAMLGMATSLDLGWFADAGMRYSVRMGDVQAVTGSLYVNDTDICTFEMYMDYTNMIVYACVPEISPYYLKVSMEGIYDDQMTDFMADPMVLYPDAQVLKDLLSRYMTIVFDGFESGEGSAVTVQLNGTDMEVMEYEGQMYEQNAFDMVNALLKTARDDEQLREVIESWTTALLPEEGDVYGSFQSEIDTLLSDMNADGVSGDESSYISSVVWVDADGKVVGRGLGFVDSGEEQPFFAYSDLQNETDSELSVTINADDVIIALEGSGKTENGKLNGTYAISVDGAEAAEITVTDYDVAAMEAGALNASYKLKLKDGFMDDESYNMLTSFEVNVDCMTDQETGASEVTLGLTTTDILLGAMTISGVYEDAEALPELSTLENVLDLESDEDATVFVESLNWTPIMDNCLQAGIPQELVDMADALIYDALYGYDEYEEFEYEDEF